MKKIKICLLLLVGIFASSCDDALDITQPGQTSPEATFTSIQGLELNLAGVYGRLNYENTISFSTVFTDEVGLGVSNGGQGINDGSYSYVLNTGSDGPNSIWSSYYSCINNCNRLLIGAQSVPINSDDDQEKFDHILAQAKAIRAFAYFQLLSYFSTDLADDSALGVMLFEDAPVYGSPTIPRSTNGEVFALINSDLDFAVDNLDETLYSSGDNTAFFISNNFINAFRARMAAFREDYVTAEMYADQVMGTVGLSSYTEYPAIWNDSQNGEVIFKLSRSINDAKVGSIWASVNASVTGSPFFEIGRSLFNLYDAARDIRYKVVMHPSGQPAQDYQNTPNYRADDILPVGKYTRTENTNLLADIKVFRVSEMYFIKAEARAAAGDYAGAAAVLYEVMEARYNPNSAPPTLPVFANAQQAWAGILQERRKELAFEGHRYVDLKRLAVKAGVTIDRDPKDCEFNNSCTFSNTDHRWTLPVPTTELTANPQIRGQQNPGY
ncbi:RagB/SusD family nutrient uptake outer membrane protein [Flavobacterium kingsejongi]|uniref:RagB/SusD family nutrient uptake outer membrane protein n=1 Tax=Flavobacterium kingsejongi TaxID=1678728 RepID=A0A2S1LJ66_9FLAO|nr:RagB/SusD family nutrient uptake outer membrane protein [Flavobacterium kingsejongi]AWG23767.1 hypothetical protein FK004_00260 [Flavobacterium kingsejongi]